MSGQARELESGIHILKWLQVPAVAVDEPKDSVGPFLHPDEGCGSKAGLALCQEIKVSFLQDPEWLLYVGKACLPNDSRAEREVRAWEWEKGGGNREEWGLVI